MHFITSIYNFPTAIRDPFFWISSEQLLYVRIDVSIEDICAWVTVTKTTATLKMAGEHKQLAFNDSIIQTVW